MSKKTEILKRLITFKFCVIAILAANLFFIYQIHEQDKETIKNQQSVMEQLTILFKKYAELSQKLNDINIPASK